MLPNRDNRNKLIPLTVDNSGHDLATEARRRCMGRLINAIQTQDISAALEAFQDLCALGEYTESE